MWVIGGYSSGANYRNDVWYSTDGVVWTQATASAAFLFRYSPTSVVYDNKMWVIGGYRSIDDYRNDIWYSIDGIIWTQATASPTFPGRYNHTSVVYNNKIWVISGRGNGGYRNDVWYSLMMTDVFYDIWGLY